MGDIATASHAHDTPLSSIGDDRRPSTSSYGSSTGGVAQDTSGHLDQRKRGNGSMSSADSRNYAGHPQQVVSAATGRQRTGSTGGRPRTSGSEASSVRSTKSGTVVNGSGRIYTSIAPLAGERSSPVPNHASRVPKIVPMVARPGSAEDLSSFEYELVVRQQPKQARLCNGNDKLPKGPVDPPPVVRLQISRSTSSTAGPQQTHLRSPTTANSDESSLSSGSNFAPVNKSSHGQSSSNLTSASLIQSPYLFCFAALCKADEDEELYLLADGKTRYVTGNVVSSLYHLKDPRDGSAEGFFVFPDIGVRVEGTFRLKLSLYEMVDATVHHCKTVYTEPFQVYSPKRFPGVQDSTELSKSFATQGLKMRIKGGPARTGGKPVDGPPRTGNSDYSRPDSSNDPTTSVKRPRTASDNIYSHPDEVNKRQALQTSPGAAYHRDLYGSFRYHSSAALNEREMYSVPEREVYQPRPVSSSYSSTTESHGYPSSIDARARFRDQQYYPPRTAGPAPDRPADPTGVSSYTPQAAHTGPHRPTTAPATPSPYAPSSRLTQTPNKHHYPYPLAEHVPVHGARPSSSSGESMPPPRGFGLPAASRYHPSEAYEPYQPYTQYQHEVHSRYARPPTDPYLSKIPPSSSRSRPTSSSGGQRITLPPLSEMIRRPDLDPPSIPASTSSLRTLLNPEARTPAKACPLPSREHDTSSQALSSHTRGPSPLVHEDLDHLSEEDRRYFEIRSRQMLHRRSSATDDM